MLKKHGKFYADWRDSTGRRHRAAFGTEAEAIAHQKAMRDTAHPSKPSAPSRKRRRSSSKRTQPTRTQKPRSKPSRKSSAKSKPATSRRKK